MRETVTLPPAVRRLLAGNPGTMTLDGTNTWIVDAGSERIVIDPGPRLTAHLRGIAAAGPIAAFLLTHRHADHAEAIDAFPDIPVHAGDATLARHAEPLRDGEELVFGSVRIRAHATPGHTDDSMCFTAELPRASAAGAMPVVFLGDTLLAGRRSTYLAFTGDLAALLLSLDRLAAWRGRLGLPGHGPMVRDVADAATDALQHHGARLAALRKRLDAHRRSGETADPDAIARSRHPGRPELWAASRRQVVAELEYLLVHP